MFWYDQKGLNPTNWISISFPEPLSPACWQLHFGSARYPGTRRRDLHLSIKMQSHICLPGKNVVWYSALRGTLWYIPRMNGELKHLERAFLNHGWHAHSGLAKGLSVDSANGWRDAPSVCTGANTTVEDAQVIDHRLLQPDRLHYSWVRQSIRTYEYAFQDSSRLLMRATASQVLTSQRKDNWIGLANAHESSRELARPT